MSNPKEIEILGVKVSCISWELTYNEHLTYYQEVQEYYDEEYLSGIDTTKDIYCLIVYPITPVGHYKILANSLEQLAEKLK